MNIQYVDFIFALLSLILFWLAAMLIFRYESFTKNGAKKDIRSTDIGHDRAGKIASHNDGIYKDLDFFYKISLAIFGGIGFSILKVNANNEELIKLLISFGFYLQLLSSLAVALIVISHKRSIILRWSKRFSWYHVFFWGDTWGFIFGMTLSLYAFIIARPYITNAISDFAIN